MNICPKCKGRGYIRNTADTVIMGIFSLGVIPLLESTGQDKHNQFLEECNICKTKGLINDEIDME